MHPLVDAFYKGRATLKRGRGEFFDDDAKPKKACYVGAIYYGLYKTARVPENSAVPLAIERDWPQFRYWTNAPCGCDKEGGLISAILVHLNDAHDAREWGDKKISDWLESVYAGNTCYSTKEAFDKTLQQVQT